MASSSSSPIFILLSIFTLAVGSTPVVSESSNLTDGCIDHGGPNEGGVSILEGEAGWLSCPLFSYPSVYNFNSTQSAGHSLVWYHIPEGQHLEQPIKYSLRLSKERERLWLQPASAQDSGLYICLLQNRSSCSKIGMRLKVLPHQDGDEGCGRAVSITRAVIPLQSSQLLHCPDLQAVTRITDIEPTVQWRHLTANGRCNKYPFWNTDRQMKGSSLNVLIMMDSFRGLYFCTVTYERKGQTLSFTRSINVTAVSPAPLSKLPSILQPVADYVFTVKLGTEVRLVCIALFPYLESHWDIWWTVDGRSLKKLHDHRRFTTANSRKDEYYGDHTEENVLVIQNIGSEDLNREYNCSVRNECGFETRRVYLEEEVSVPSVELGCGLGVTLVLMLLLFVVYHIFWLELLLLYRSWFGTDERHADDKEYDVYISYARNSEEEQFVLTTLHTVLENELGYSVCIFDKDSLPGGTITDETLSFVARSRRLLVVVSPGYASRGSQALLELKAGIDGMALDGHLRVILVQYKPVQWQGWVRELRRARVALAVVRWNGDKSKELTSHFWKRLRVELPVRRVSSGKDGWGSKDVCLMRLSSQNSTNSQTGLISNTVKEPNRVLNSAT